MPTLNIHHFRARILQDALTEATAGYWEHRAEQFEEAAPRPGDYRGNADPADIFATAIRCNEVADNCRHHAQLLRDTAPEMIDPDVWTTVLKDLA